LTLQNDIDNFIDFFKDEINKIHEIENILYRKILFACALDTIATARYPKDNNQKKIVSFVLNYSGSTDISCVSLVQLIYILEHALNEQSRSDSELYRYALDGISKLEPGQLPRGHEVDPSFDEAARKANRQEIKLLKNARYAELFYGYRNMLVHGFKEPGHGIEMSGDVTNPYYHSYTDGRWELIFPVDFFESIFSEGLTNLKEYLQQYNINPYDRYESINAFSDMWTNPDKLNPKGKSSLLTRIINFIKKELTP
jgi:hypothetical protein